MTFSGRRATRPYVKDSGEIADTTIKKAIAAAVDDWPTRKSLFMRFGNANVEPASLIPKMALKSGIEIIGEFLYIQDACISFHIFGFLSLIQRSIADAATKFEYIPPNPLIKTTTVAAILNFPDTAIAKPATRDIRNTVAMPSTSSVPLSVMVIPNRLVAAMRCIALLDRPIPVRAALRVPLCKKDHSLLSPLRGVKLQWYQLEHIRLSRQTAS